MAVEMSEEQSQGRYEEVQASPEFAGLRRALRRFVFPVTVAFLSWYGLYVVLSAFARDFMGTKVFAEVNVALVFGLLQFASTFLIAWWYASYAGRRLDPAAGRIRAELEEEESADARA
ncbi:DUF485 domain-containing protein [Longispora albida]|uniref:DUF485 domain-containing protein n=1 Tax=Longispora albida TaxID=203523 RepID=UPI00058D3AA3|nr:DUF485 domain-containing protein [Longispora albida]